MTPESRICYKLKKQNHNRFHFPQMQLNLILRIAACNQKLCNYEKPELQNQYLHKRIGNVMLTNHYKH